MKNAALVFRKFVIFDNEQYSLTIMSIVVIKSSADIAVISRRLMPNLSAETGRFAVVTR